MIDCIVTTAGAIEEDFMKCMAPHYMADFYLKGKDLRQHRLNREGNILIPTWNYYLAWDFMLPLFK